MAAITAPRGYVVMTYARCGGTWFAQLLGSTGVLGRPEDWFNGRGYRDRGEVDYPLGRAGQRAAMLERGRTANGIFGVKLSPVRFDDFGGHDWTQGLGDLAWIHLVRRDRLARAISDVRAMQTRQYRSTTAVQRPPVYDETAIHDALLNHAADEARVQRYFANNGIEPLDVTYEDLAEEPERESRRVAAHLCVDEPVQLRHDRITLNIQRDRLNGEWRDRFVAANLAPARMPAREIGLSTRLVRRLRL